LSVSRVQLSSWWSRQQAKEKIWIAAGALFENRSDNKLTRISMVMLYVETVLIIFRTRLNGAVTSQNALVMFKRALDIEKFDQERTVEVDIG
jgi:hypothetical protein